MIRAERIWRIQRISGFLAMIALTLTLVAVFDGLRGGIFGSQKGVHLVPGEEYAISGPLPPRTDRLEDFVVSGNTPDGSIALIPDGIFTGYWFGGGMWRGRIVVAAQCLPGRYEFAVHDKFGEKQNPALVFQLQVFSNGQERKAHSASMIMRYTGLNPYLVAIFFGSLGIMSGIANYLSGQQWSVILAEHGCGEVFRFKQYADHSEVGVELFRGAQVPLGSRIRFTHPVRGDSCLGTVIALGKGEFTVQIEAQSPVQPGDIACMMQEDCGEAL